jgi:hypothetical protein
MMTQAGLLHRGAGKGAMSEPNATGAWKADGRSTESKRNILDDSDPAA